MSDKIIGTCSCCGGAVTIPSIWMGILPPTPSCIQCGAEPENSFGPVIKTVPKQKSKFFLDDGRNFDLDTKSELSYTIASSSTISD